MEEIHLWSVSVNVRMKTLQLRSVFVASTKYRWEKMLATDNRFEPVTALAAYKRFE
jgi:hypothetical protein